MTTLLDLDREHERFLDREKWGIGRYGIQGRLDSGELYPATGYYIKSDNLSKVVKYCQRIRDLYNTDYVVCDTENDYVIMYPDTEAK